MGDCVRVTHSIQVILFGMRAMQRGIPGMTGTPSNHDENDARKQKTSPFQIVSRTFAVIGIQVEAVKKTALL